MKKKIFLYGYYGKHNVGDEALCCVCIEQLSRLLGRECRIEVMSQVPVSHENAKAVTYTDLSRTCARMRSLASSRAIVFGGGGIFQDYTASGLADLRERWRYVLLARLLRVKVAFLGVSIGPVRTPRGLALTRRILDAADLVTVRDEKSRLFAADALSVTKNIVKSFDLAVLLEEGTGGGQGGVRDGVLGVSLMPVGRSHLLAGQDELCANVARALRWCIDRRGLRIRFIPFNRNDMAVMQDVTARIDRPKHIDFPAYSDNPREVLSSVRTCSHYLAMRLHSAIFAYMCCIPFVLIRYHDKCEGFAQEVGVGEDGLVFSLRESEMRSKLVTMLDTGMARYGVSLHEARERASDSFVRFANLMR